MPRDWAAVLLLLQQLSIILMANQVEIISKLVSTGTNYTYLV